MQSGQYRTTTEDSHHSPQYDARNRLSDVAVPCATKACSTNSWRNQSNYFNARGERVGRGIADRFGFIGGLRRTPADLLFSYDESGRLLGEYSTTGQPSRLYIWLGDTPVGVVIGTSLHYVEADHLGTPRVIVDPSRNVPVRRWDLSGSAFGDHPPITDPDGDSVSVTYDLRYPGQYFDAETGLHYNYFRDYEPGTGRFIESDPIGLRGGPSTYIYVGGGPLGRVDPEGLAYFAKRPLGNRESYWMGISSCWNGGPDDRMNTEVSHEHIFFEDGIDPPNVGFGPDGLFTESSEAGYRCRSGSYNDCLMRKAVDNTPPRRPYCLLGAPGGLEKYNCQDWADDVRAEYSRLAKDESARKECGLCEQ